MLCSGPIVNNKILYTGSVTTGKGLAKRVELLCNIIGKDYRLELGRYHIFYVL